MGSTDRRGGEHHFNGKDRGGSGLNKEAAGENGL